MIFKLHRDSDRGPKFIVRDSDSRGGVTMHCRRYFGASCARGTEQDFLANSILKEVYFSKYHSQSRVASRLLRKIT